MLGVFSPPKRNLDLHHSKVPVKGMSTHSSISKTVELNKGRDLVTLGWLKVGACQVSDLSMAWNMQCFSAYLEYGILLISHGTRR